MELYRGTDGPTSPERGIVALAAALIALACCISTVDAEVLPPLERKQIWDVQLGQRVDEIARGDFISVACGTDGGPPSTALLGFAEFMRCPAEASGLREVYFEYDDEALYWAKAHENQLMVDRIGGTRVFGFDVIVSLLVDDAGIVRGVRVVSDPRPAATDEQRARAADMGAFAKAHFGSDGWDCIDRPPRDRFEPAEGYVDQVCEKVEADRRLFVDMARFRKPGQARIDPFTGRINRASQAFESRARLEIWHPSARVPGLGERAEDLR